MNIVHADTDLQILRLRDTLKESGYSITTPRKLVFEVLLSGPASHTHVTEALRETIDRATVYRTLDLYERLGVVNRIWHGLKSHVELSEIFLPHHHHANCQRCGDSLDIISSELELLLSKLARKHSFLAVQHSVEISGYCQRCQ